MIARIVGMEGIDVSAANNRFVQLCFHVLESKAPSKSGEAEKKLAFVKALTGFIEHFCQVGKAPAGKAAKSASRAKPQIGDVA
jgi:hypothetical protein